MKLFARAKKGSKIYRNYMIGDRQKKMNINKLKTVTVFYNLIEIERRAEKLSKATIVCGGYTGSRKGSVSFCLNSLIINLV